MKKVYKMEKAYSTRLSNIVMGLDWSLAWSETTSLVIGMVRDNLSGHWHVRRQPLWSLAWSETTSLVIGMVRDNLSGHWHGRRQPLWSLAWSETTSLVIGMVGDNLSGHWHGQRQPLWSLAWSDTASQLFKEQIQIKSENKFLNCHVVTRFLTGV